MGSRAKAPNLIVAGEFERPPNGFTWTCDTCPHGLTPSGLPGWQSNGGTGSHPWRSLPSQMDCAVPEGYGVLRRVHLVGVLGLGCDQEQPRIPGASVQFLAAEETVLAIPLVAGRHYLEATDGAPRNALLGDGTSVESVCTSVIQNRVCRVDLMTVDVPPDVAPQRLSFRDLGSPASFVVFDVFFEFEAPAGCPFHPKGGGVPLAEVGAIVRIGDRVRLQRSLRQMEAAVWHTDDLDEARGEALMFIAMVAAGMLEVGGSRELHRAQLQASRLLDRLTDQRSIAAEARRIVESIAFPLFQEPSNPTDELIDRALQLVERHYAKDLTDASVATQLGLSTSHFRHLFRKATGQPFHRYLIALRLEKARALLVEQDEASISEVAAAVGFTGASHFSRAFSQRFSVSPQSLRKSVR